MKKPYIFTSFVSTLDGKVAVKKDGYWPIGTSKDYEFFTNLRAQADVIVDGRNTALVFGKKTIETIHRPSFLKMREKLGKTKKIAYVVLTNRSDKELSDSLQNEYDFKPHIMTSDVSSFMDHCKKRGWKYVFIDGGPTLIASFLEQELLDELFITISPKIFGSEQGKTLTMVEGKLFKPEKIKRFRLISAEKVEDEVFLRYAKKRAITFRL